MNILNKSLSHGLFIGSTLSVRRDPFINRIGFKQTGGGFNINIDGVGVTYSNVFVGVLPWGVDNNSNGSLSFWVYFIDLNFNTEQTILTNVGQGGANGSDRINRWFKNTNNELIIQYTNTTNTPTIATYSTGITFSSNVLYHFAINLNNTGTYNPLTETISSPSNFMLNGKNYYITKDIVPQLDRFSTEISYPTFGGGGSSFLLFDIVYTRQKLDFTKALYLYNNGMGVDLNQIKYTSPYNDGFVFDTLLLKKPLKRPSNFLTTQLGPQYGDFYLDYTNNGYSPIKSVYDNSENYQPLRNGENVFQKSNILPISGNILDYIYDGSTYVEINGLTGSFSGQELDIIPDTIDILKFTNCSFIGDLRFGEVSANYSFISFVGCSGNNLFLYGSKKDYRLEIINSTFSQVFIYGTSSNKGLCSTTSFDRNDDNIVSIRGNSINRFIFGDGFKLNNSFNIRYLNSGFSGTFNISNTPSGSFYELVNSDLCSDGFNIFESEYLPTNLATSSVNIETIPNGLSGLSSSVSNPLDFKSHNFLYEINISSRNHKYIILPTTPSLRVISMLNVDLTNSSVLNLFPHSTTLNKFEIINYDNNKPFEENLDFGSFSNLSVIGGYFSGSVTLPLTDNLLDLRIIRNSNAARTSGSNGPGLISLNRIPLSTTRIILSNNTTFIGITGLNGISFGAGRTISISEFSASSGSYQFISVPTHSTFQFTSIFNIGGTTQCLCPTFSGITWSMFPSVNTLFDVSNTDHTSITDIGLPLGTTIRSRGINISQSFSNLSMGITALSSTIENIYNNWGNFLTASKTINWTYVGITQTSGLLPSGFTLGVSDGTFSSNLFTRIRELKYVLTTQTLSGSLKYNWVFTP